MAILEIIKDSYELAVEAERLGMVDEGTVQELRALLPKCKTCGAELESRDEKFCSPDCAEIWHYRIEEAAATGN